MKVKTTETLKVGRDETLPAGTMFTGAVGSFPHYIQDLITASSRALLILEEDLPEKVVEPVSVAKPAVTAKSTVKKAKSTQKPTVKPRTRRKSTKSTGD